MYRLSDDLPAVNLAFSLHAPNQEVRLKIVPAAKAHPLEKLMEAIDYHVKRNNEQFANTVPTKVKKAPPKASATSSPRVKEVKENEEEEGNDITTGEEDGGADGVDEADEAVEGEDEIDLNTRYWKKSNKLTGIMIEYILIKDVNDRNEHAHELAQLLYSRRDFILLNLIPYNPTEVAEDYQPPDHEQVLNFSKICMSKPYEIHTRIRQEKGQDIAGACGQLALVKGQQKQQEHEHKHGDHNHSHSKEGKKETAMEDIGSKKTAASNVNLTPSSKSVNFSDPIATEGTIHLETKRKNQLCQALFYANIAVPVVLSLASYFSQQR